MISVMMFLLSLFTGKQVQAHPIEVVHHDTLSVAALADGMSYYQSQAVESCWHNGAMSCGAGEVHLTTRTGSQSQIAYGAGYNTTTDGSTYVMTTLAGNGEVAGRTSDHSSINSGVFAALKNMTGTSSTIGYYDQQSGGIVLPDQQNEVVQGTFLSAPVQGQPVLFTSLVAPSPPAQVASIDGGGYAPLVPIPPSITPSPIQPAAIISPPTSVSPPASISPTYTPPATVIVNPISPWAPSPVPPPPPPPPPPVPPPPPSPPPPPPPPSYFQACDATDKIGVTIDDQYGYMELGCKTAFGSNRGRFSVIALVWFSPHGTFSMPPSWITKYGLDVNAIADGEYIATLPNTGGWNQYINQYPAASIYFYNRYATPFAGLVQQAVSSGPATWSAATPMQDALYQGGLQAPDGERCFSFLDGASKPQEFWYMGRTPMAGAPNACD